MITKSIKKTFVAGAMSAVLGVLVPTISEAACTQADLTGTWYLMFAAGNVASGEYEASVRCKLVVSSTGAITANSAGCVARSSSNGTSAANFNVAVLGGSFKVNSTCGITGSFRYNDGSGAATETIGFAQMAKDKNTFAFTAYEGPSADVGEAVKQ